MSHSPSLGIPELAGLATYGEAARPGLSVDDNVRRLLRLHWVEKRLSEIAVAHIPGTPEWEVKCALSLHQWQDAEHAEALRRRVSEMRSPAPRMDETPDAALSAFFDEVLRARDTVELLTGLYPVTRSALTDAYLWHLKETNPLVDHPTCRIMRFALLEHEDVLAWGERALAALIERDAAASERSTAWAEHLYAYLQNAGGIMGNLERPATLPSPRSADPWSPNFHPRRDARFSGQYNFNFPPHVVYNTPGVPPDERNLALLCKRTLEMDVPEMMASFMVERTDLPWAIRLDYSRQLWDEARHAMMGTVAFEARGIDWTRIPLNVSFALRLNLHATAHERQCMLFGIEQTLMAGDTGKRFEYETAVESGDELSARFHDYDWADEVLHTQIGRRWLRHEGLTAAEAKAIGLAAHEKTWAALEQYRHLDPQADWWNDFVRSALGRDTAASADSLAERKVISE